MSDDFLDRGDQWIGGDQGRHITLGCRDIKRSPSSSLLQHSPFSAHPTALRQLLGVFLQPVGGVDPRRSSA